MVSVSFSSSNILIKMSMFVFILCSFRAAASFLNAMQTESTYYHCIASKIWFMCSSSSPEIEDIKLGVIPHTYNHFWCTKVNEFVAILSSILKHKIFHSVKLLHSKRTAHRLHYDTNIVKFTLIIQPCTGVLCRDNFIYIKAHFTFQELIIVATPFSNSCPGW